MTDEEGTVLASASAIIAVVASRKWRQCCTGHSLGRSINLKFVESIHHNHTRFCTSFMMITEMACASTQHNTSHINIHELSTLSPVCPNCCIQQMDTKCLACCKKTLRIRVSEVAGSCSNQLIQVYL